MRENAYLQFSELIKVDGRYREFNFLRKKAGEKIIFNVDVADEAGNRYYFDLLSLDNKWNITGQSIPEWISKSEVEIRSAIHDKVIDKK